MKTNAGLFWKRINSLIKAQKTKQEAIAAQCGISYQTFRGWVTRNTFPDADEAQKIAQALGTTVEYLVTGKIADLTAAEKTIDEIQAAINRLRKK